MKLSNSIALSLLSAATAQNVTVPTTCTGDYQSGTSTALVTVPYTYEQVLSIIGSYKNLTWSGNPDDTVTLNGTDNTVGTARTYHLDGLTVIETILTYDSPPGGPYSENHNTYMVTIPQASGNFSVYIPNDETTVMSVCDGKATSFNFTAEFCSTNVTAAGGLLTMLHTTDALTVGKFLGGQNFTSCAALQGNASSTAPPTSTYTGAAAVQYASPALTIMTGLLLWML